MQLKSPLVTKGTEITPPGAQRHGEQYIWLCAILHGMARVLRQRLRIINIRSQSDILLWHCCPSMIKRHIIIGIRNQQCSWRETYVFRYKLWIDFIGVCWYQTIIATGSKTFPGIWNVHILNREGLYRCLMLYGSVSHIRRQDFVWRNGVLMLTRPYKTIQKVSTEM